MDLGALFYAFINVAGIGGAFVILVYITALTTYFFLTRWILQGGRVKSKDQE
jgi:hypothetical protein